MHSIVSYRIVWYMKFETTHRYLWADNSWITDKTGLDIVVFHYVVQTINRQ